MTGAERWRIWRLTEFMALYCPPKASLWFASFDSGTSWSRASSIWKRFGKLQAEHGLPRYSVLLREPSKNAEPGGHVIFIGNKKIAQRLRNSEPLAAEKALQPVHNWKRLVGGYLSKKRTPTPHDGRGRIRGSHPVDGGGDRVRPSEALKSDAIAAAFLEPWARTNARRSTSRKAYRSRRLVRRAVRFIGQLWLLPECDREVSRLRDFAGGYIPRAVALEIEFRRGQRGLSQRELGNQIGRSQGQLANALRGHDPISRTAVNRLREILLNRSG